MWAAYVCDLGLYMPGLWQINKVFWIIWQFSGSGGLVNLKHLWQREVSLMKALGILLAKSATLPLSLLSGLLLQCNQQTMQPMLLIAPF